MDGILAEEPAASKLQVQLAVAALITTVSVFLATLAGQDPWGKRRRGCSEMACFLGQCFAPDLPWQIWGGESEERGTKT
eukprot:scaffold223584_cov23-Tisochrysis_lutea.AAC.1